MCAGEGNQHRCQKRDAFHPSRHKRSPEYLESYLFYNPEAVRRLLPPRIIPVVGESQNHETQRNGVSGGRQELAVSLPNLPFSSFLRVSKVLIFCYLARFPTF